LRVPRPAGAGDGGATRKWRSGVLPRYARRARQLEALVVGAYLAGTDRRRLQRALAALCNALMALP
jgi:hypothetical protein